MLPVVMNCNQLSLNSNCCYIMLGRLSASILSIVSDTEHTGSADEKGRSRQRKYPLCVCEREREKGKREPRRYKLKLQEFLWPCISVSVGLGFPTNIPCEFQREGGKTSAQSIYFKLKTSSNRTA